MFFAVGVLVHPFKLGMAKHKAGPANSRATLRKQHCCCIAKGFSACFVATCEIKPWDGRAKVFQEHVVWGAGTTHDASLHPLQPAAFRVLQKFKVACRSG